MDTFYAFCFITWATLLELSMLVLPRALVGEGGNCHLLVIRVCAAGKGVVFKPFTLV